MRQHIHLELELRPHERFLIWNHNLHKSLRKRTIREGVENPKTNSGKWAIFPETHKEVAFSVEMR
jgi:hypothetical protein